MVDGAESRETNQTPEEIATELLHKATWGSPALYAAQDFAEFCLADGYEPSVREKKREKINDRITEHRLEKPGYGYTLAQFNALYPNLARNRTAVTFGANLYGKVQEITDRPAPSPEPPPLSQQP
ncbi:MAG: hypothetical protein AAB553_04340 [Patescibacteria group bacterium]